MRDNVDNVREAKYIFGAFPACSLIPGFVSIIHCSEERSERR
jgi:hypothetical protein